VTMNHETYRSAGGIWGVAPPSLSLADLTTNDIRVVLAFKLASYDTTTIMSLTTPQNFTNDLSFPTLYSNITDFRSFFSACFSVVVITDLILDVLNCIRVYVWYMTTRSKCDDAWLYQNFSKSR